MLSSVSILVLLSFTVPAAVGVTGVPAAPSTTASAGYRVFLDPVTGQIVSEPSATQEREMGRARERWQQRDWRSAWELRHFYMPGGGEGVALDGWADHALEVKRDQGGKLRAGCTQGDEHDRSSRPSGEPSGAPKQ